MAFYFVDAYVGVSRPLIQYLKMFKKFSLGAELQPLRASPTMSLPQTCSFFDVAQGGEWACGPEQLAATVPCATVYSGTLKRGSSSILVWALALTPEGCRFDP